MLSIYKASAGSGKTHTLTGEYLRMLFREYQSTNETKAPHSHILAVTFTKKATNEMVFETLNGEKYHIDLAFEGGEAETLAIDGPIFKKKIKIGEYEMDLNYKELLKESLFFNKLNFPQYNRAKND